MTANEQQVGGDHYKTGGEEHWDRQWRLYGRGYFVGQITKYVERYHKKNGVQDLQKAKHFLEKLIELESENGPTVVGCTCGSASNPTRTVHLPGCALLKAFSLPEAGGNYVNQGD